MEYDMNINMNINWFAVTIIIFWVFSFFGSIFTKNADPFVIAMITSIIFGIGYFFTHVD